MCNPWTCSQGRHILEKHNPRNYSYEIQPQLVEPGRKPRQRYVHQNIGSSRIVLLSNRPFQSDKPKTIWDQIRSKFFIDATRFKYPSPFFRERALGEGRLSNLPPRMGQSKVIPLTMRDAHTQGPCQLNFYPAAFMIARVDQSWACKPGWISSALSSRPANCSGLWIRIGKQDEQIKRSFPWKLNWRMGISPSFRSQLIQLPSKSLETIELPRFHYI